MIVESWLREKEGVLSAAGIATARLDCLVLLEDVLRTDRTQLLAHDDQELGSEQIAKLDSLIKRRANHEPLAYIRGKTEFYGRVFAITPATLEPRPETETMVEMLKAKVIKRLSFSSVVDVGTGSGAIAVTVKLEHPELTVSATEINPEALKVAKANAKKLEADIAFYQGNLLEPVPHLDEYIILANLPYVPDSHTINQAAMQEPKVAIFGGSDGLELYRELFGQISELKSGPVVILTESLPFQHHGLATIARHYGYIQEASEDFIQLFVRG
ncbi:MAG TPA: peptide chain release factor N(5)-glutamine methyltransferase [Patescibacteria group bacterium]|nr:peptide chain release factor N(5)-glutamine methyltransferase [Patescibacteria group bacterium]